MSCKKTGPIFYGWIIVFSCAIVTGVVLGLYYNTLSVFAKPVCEALGFTRAQFNLYNTIVSLLNMLMMPVYSRLYRRFPVRRVMILCGAAISLAPFLCSFMRDLRAFYLIALMTGLFTSGVSIMGVNVLLNNWFVEKRGVAIGLAFSGSGVSAALMVPFLTWVIGQYGWQWGYRVLALTGGALLLPTLIFLIREHPEQMGLRPLGAHLAAAGAPPKEKIGLTLKQAVKKPTFWLLMALGLFTTMTMTGIQQHTIPYLTDIGYSAVFASSVMSLMMLLMTGSKMLLGVIFDRFGPLLGGSLCATAGFLSALLLLSAAHPIAPWLFAVTMSMSFSAGSVPPGYLTAYYFGDRDFAGIYAFIMMGNSMGTAIAPSLSGLIYDVTGNYITAWILYLGTSAMMAVCTFSAYYTSRRIVLE